MVINIERDAVVAVEGGALGQHLLDILHAHEGRYEEAEAAFLRALGVESEMAGSYVELGLVYTCRGEYRKIIEALRRAVSVGAGGVRAYLGEQPLGRNAGGTVSGAEDAGEEVLPLVTAMAHLAEGHDHEAAALLERSCGDKPSGGPVAVALLALAYLLRGEDIEADALGVRRVAAPAGGGSGGG